MLMELIYHNGLKNFVTVTITSIILLHYFFKTDPTNQAILGLVGSGSVATGILLIQWSWHTLAQEVGNSLSKIDAAELSWVLLESPLAEERFGPTCFKIGPCVLELLLDHYDVPKMYHLEVTENFFHDLVRRRRCNLASTGPIWKQQRLFCSELCGKSNCNLWKFAHKFTIYRYYLC